MVLWPSFIVPWAFAATQPSSAPSRNAAMMMKTVQTLSNDFITTTVWQPASEVLSAMRGNMSTAAAACWARLCGTTALNGRPPIAERMAQPIITLVKPSASINHVGILPKASCSMATTMRRRLSEVIVLSEALAIGEDDQLGPNLHSEPGELPTSI